MTRVTMKMIKLPLKLIAPDDSAIRKEAKGLLLVNVISKLTRCGFWVGKCCVNSRWIRIILGL